MFEGLNAYQQLPVVSQSRYGAHGGYLPANSMIFDEGGGVSQYREFIICMIGSRS
jgi:hypothetical protein